jgi:prephenate dehydrogenase
LGFRTFGIVGYGHMGQFMARSLARHGEVLVTDRMSPDLAAPDLRPGAHRHPVRPASLDDVARCDVVMLAVPFAALSPVLGAVSGTLGPDTVVMEVVSTKVLSTELLTRVLAGHGHLLATHPLFGPPSMAKMAKGDRLVVTHRRGDRAEEFLEFLRRKFGVVVHEMLPEDHDRAMAYMQALPFFIARALVDLDIQGLQHRDLLSIPSFEKLATIAMIEEHHTDAMFDTSQRSNPFAAAARKQLVQVLAKLDAEIGAGHTSHHTGMHADPDLLQPEALQPDPSA